MRFSFLSFRNCREEARKKRERPGQQLIEPRSQAKPDGKGTPVPETDRIFFSLARERTSGGEGATNFSGWYFIFSFLVVKIGDKSGREGTDMRDDDIRRNRRRTSSLWVS